MTLSGARNDTVMDNTFSNNGAWGFLMVPFPDSGTPRHIVSRRDAPLTVPVAGSAALDVPWKAWYSLPTNAGS